MASANSQHTRLSAIFQSHYLRQVFSKAERDTPPEPLGVAIEPDAPLAPGAVVRSSVEA